MTLKKTKTPTTHFFKKVIPIPIYGSYFIIVFSNDNEKVGRVVSLSPEKVGYIYALTFHNFIHKGYESFAVVYNFWTQDTITLGTIMHEVNHAGNRILDSREIIPDWENDEAECYLKGFLADEVQHFMQKCGIA
jgi:hypothetical protein